MEHTAHMHVKPTNRNTEGGWLWKNKILKIISLQLAQALC